MQPLCKLAQALLCERGLAVSVDLLVLRCQVLGERFSGLLAKASAHSIDNIIKLMHVGWAMSLSKCSLGA